MKLRDYQSAAVDAVFSYWDRAPAGSSPLVVMPTGSGKSATLGECVRRLAGEFGCRVVVATHRRELIVQDAEAIRRIYPQAQLGIVSAGLGRKEYGYAITVGGVQSMASKPELLGHVEVLIIDECHLLAPDADTQYGKIIAHLRTVNPDLRLLGFTATPMRLGQGLLTEGEGALFTSICYTVDVKKLIADGWLSDIKTTSVSANVNLEGVGVAGGEFIARDLELASDVDSINDAVAADVVATGRRSVLVFGTSVAHVRRLANALRIRGMSTEVVTGETTPAERDAIIGAFKAKKLQCIVSCEVLTTGFDAPNVDVVALVRATMSPTLYVQMTGRGMRTAEGKKDCCLLDYGGNIARHGPVDAVKVKPKKAGNGEAPVKVCPTCCALCAPAARVCEHCGHQFPAPVRKANDVASSLPALSEPPRDVEVGRVEWAKHFKKDNPDAPATLRVDYYPRGASVRKICSEWICIEHEEGTFPWNKAFEWWNANVDADFPVDINEALELLDDGCLRPIKSVKVQKEGKWDRVLMLEHGEARQPGEDKVDDAPPSFGFIDDDLPF